MDQGIDRDKLERALRDAEALPPCPAVLAKVATECRNPQSSARDLGRVIATDEALTSRLIKLVNSSYYGLRGTISTVTQAVVILGYQEIKNLVYSVQTEQLFRQGAAAGGIDVLALWDHSLQVAVLARECSYRVRYPVPEEVFVSGIIHDIGQVLLSQLIGDPYRRFLARTHADGQDLAAAEQAAFGTDHAELGARLTAKWNFPASLELAVRHHHRLPEGQAGLAGIAPMIVAANVVALARDRGRSGEDILAGMPARVRDFLRLDLARLEEVLAAGAEEYGRIRGSFDLAGNADQADEEPAP